MAGKKVDIAKRRETPALRRLREDLGVTMGEAAREYGCTVAEWCAAELRLKRVAAETLHAVMNAADRKKLTRASVEAAEALARIDADADAHVVNDIVPAEDPACPLFGVRGHMACNDHRYDGCRFWEAES